MSLERFLDSLFKEGRVQAPRPTELSPEDCLASLECLRRNEALARRELLNASPGWQESSALDAALAFYRACQFLVYREFDETAVREAFEGLPDSDTVVDASLAWSVDLTWRFLPDLHRLARSLSPNDPLTLQLTEIARRWPLSSVGVELCESPAEFRVRAILEHNSLRRLYLDRIIAHRDFTRLEHESTRVGTREALGAFPELAAEFARYWTKMPGHTG